MNVHNSPKDGTPGGREGERDRATAKEIAVLNDLSAEDLPVYFLGDMNEHEEIFCKITGQTSLVAAARRQQRRRRLPAAAQHAGRLDLRFDRPGRLLQRLRDGPEPLERQTTDHALLTARVNVP